MSMEQYSAPESKDDDGLSPEEREMADYYLSLIEGENTLEKEKRDCQLEIVELQNLFADFETKHSVEALYAIIDLTADEAPNHPVREPAKKDLSPIVAKLNTLEKETNISQDKYLELQAQYRHLSMAVGIVNNNKVRHD
ncbi:MAG: hypothetical protein WCJ57_02970 [Candidatus Falkowbacteria bacterium]